MGAYAASKAGVLKLTEALAAELADAGINVNAVLPSIIDTPQNRRDMPGADTSRWVRPADLAKVVLFFLGEDSAAVTGAALPVTVGARS
ncbi:putative ketoacyl reductase [compost metagenome]